MPAAHAGIEELDVFRLHKLVDMLDLTVFRRDKKLQLLRQLAFRMTLDPVATERVVHHVADNPVRCEKLGSSRDVFLFYSFSMYWINDLFVPSGNIILIQPADDLDGILPVLFGNVRDHAAEDVIGTQKIVREKQLRPVGDLLKHAGQRGVERIALRDEKIFIERLIFLLIKKPQNYAAIQPVQLHGHGFLENLRLERAVLVREKAHLGREIVVHFHEAQRDKAVEPCIRRLFHDLIEALVADLADKLASLALFGVCQQSAAGGVQFGLVPAAGDLIRKRTLFYGADELHTRPDGKFLNGVFVHGSLPPSGAAPDYIICSTSLPSRSASSFSLMSATYLSISASLSSFAV